MGQVSLVRLNRINCSMIWESNLHELNDIHWLSTKFYIFFKFFLPTLFYNKRYNFFKFWKTAHLTSFSPFNISSNPTKNKYINRCETNWHLKNYHIGLKKTKIFYVKILQFFIYSSNNQTYIFIIYINSKKFKNLYNKNINTKKNLLVFFKKNKTIKKNYFLY